MDCRVSQAIRILEGPSALAHPPRLADLADRIGLSPSHLWHLFVEQVEATPATYARTARLKHAAELLLLSQLSVKEITVAIGFRSESHFVHEFRREFGVPPRTYRIDAIKS